MTEKKISKLREILLRELLFPLRIRNCGISVYDDGKAQGYNEYRNELEQKIKELVEDDNYEDE